MIARTLFWKKFKKLIFGSFAIVFGAITCCLLGSWTTNDNNEIESELIDSYVYSNNSNYYAQNYNSWWDYPNDYRSIFNNLPVGSRFYLQVDDNGNYEDTLIWNSTIYEHFNNNNAYSYFNVITLDNSTSSIDYTIKISNSMANSLNEKSNNIYVCFYSTYRITDLSFYLGAIDSNFNGFEDGFSIDYFIYTRQSFISSYVGHNYLTYYNSTLDFCYFNIVSLVKSNTYSSSQMTQFANSFAFTFSVGVPNSSSYVTSPYLYNTYDLYYNYADYYTDLSNYDDLLSNFNDLESDYNDLESNYNNLQSNYNTLQSTYNDYVSSHSYTNSEFNALDFQYSQLQQNALQLEQDYLALQQQYNELLNSSSNINKLNYHIWIAQQNGSQTQYDFTKVQQLSSSDYIDDLGYMDISSIYTSYINGTNNVILVELDNSLNALNYDLMFNVNGSGNNINIMPKFINFNPVQTPLYGLTSTNNSSLTLTNFIKYQDSSVTNIVNYAYSEFAIIYTNLGNDLINIKLNGQGDYNLGYLNGLEQNNADFVDLQQDYDDLSTNYDTLQGRYDVLLDQYNTLANGHLELSMRNLVWYIASTPFESFKSIWNVDFLGLNIASFFTGLFSVFIIVWILKKIF